MLAELRFAARALMRSRAASAAVVLSLGVAVSTLVGVAAIRSAIRGKGLTLNQSGRVVHLVTKSTEFTEGRIWAVRKAVVRAAGENDVIFSAVAAYSETQVTVRGDGWATRLPATYVTSSFFSTVGARMKIGQLFVAGDEATAEQPAVVLGEPLWKSRFGSDSGIVGRSIAINGQRSRVVGVMATQTEFPERSRLWILTSIDKTGSLALDDQVSSVAVLRNGVSVARAAQALADIGIRLDRAGKRAITRQRQVGAAPFAEYLQSRIRRPLTMMTALGALIVVLTAVNFVTLVLARGIKRRDELGIRAALGASVRRLVWQGVAECVVLSAAGGLAGVLLAPYVLGALNAALEGLVPPWVTLQLDWTILLTAIGSAGAMGALIGLAPAVELARPASVGFVRSGTGASGVDPRQARGRRLLVGFQVALATGALVCIGGVYGSAFATRTPEMGFDQSNLLLGAVEFDTSLIAPSFAAGRTSLALGMHNVPGVAAVGLWRPTNVEPSSINVDAAAGSGTGSRRSPVPEARARWLVWTEVSDGFFAALRPSIISGRYPNDDELARGEPVAVVTEAASLWLTGGNAIGSTVSVSSEALGRRTVTIVGVVGDMREHAYYEFPSPMLFVPFGPDAAGGRSDLYIWIRANRQPASVASLIQSSLRLAAPAATIIDLRESREVFTEELRSVRSVAVIASAVFVVGILLSALGIYGIVAFTAATRRSEIAVRIALGASRRHIATLLLRETALVAAVALAIGAPLGAAVAASIRGGVAIVAQPAAVSAVVALLALAATVGIAAAVPVRSALRASPSQALRGL